MKEPRSFRVDPNVWGRFQELCLERSIKPTTVIARFVEKCVGETVVLDALLASSLPTFEVRYHPDDGGRSNS